MSEVPRLRAGNYFVGVDLGKKQDPSAIGLIRKEVEIRRLVGLKNFPLETEYVAVLGYLRLLVERIQTVATVLVDQTGVGEPFVEEARKNIRQVDGLVLTLPVKQDVQGYLKLLMQSKQLLVPYELELITELNIERFELTKAGQVMFSHPNGTHDDRNWAVALAAFATRTPPFPQLTRSRTIWVE